jgi:hypothetical protein
MLDRAHEPLGDAVRYLTNQWAALQRFVDHGGSPSITIAPRILVAAVRELRADTDVRSLARMIEVTLDGSFPGVDAVSGGLRCSALARRPRGQRCARSDKTGHRTADRKLWRDLCTVKMRKPTSAGEQEVQTTKVVRRARSVVRTAGLRVAAEIVCNGGQSLEEASLFCSINRTGRRIPERRSLFANLGPAPAAGGK